MTAPLAVAAQPLAIDVLHVLRELDPARWRADKMSQVRARLEDIHMRVDGLVDGSLPDASGLRDKLTVMRDVLQHHVEENRERKEESEATVRERFMTLRARLQPAYESLAASLRRSAIHVPSLRPTNYARNAFHVASALVALFVIEVVPHLMVFIAGAFALSGWTMEISRRQSTRANDLLMKLFGPVAHPHERHRINSATWYSSALVILALAFAPVLGAIAVTVLGFGDPAAALIGRKYGRTKLVNGRSLQGSLAFVFFGGLFTFGVLAAFHSELGTTHMILLSLAGATFGAVAELFSKTIDDNMSVPLAAACASSVTAILLSISL